MTAAQLIEFLSKLPPETPVVRHHNCNGMEYVKPVIEKAKLWNGASDFVQYHQLSDLNDTEVVVIR